MYISKCLLSPFHFCHCGLITEQNRHRGPRVQDVPVPVPQYEVSVTISGLSESSDKTHKMTNKRWHIQYKLFTVGVVGGLFTCLCPGPIICLCVSRLYSLLMKNGFRVWKKSIFLMSSPHNQLQTVCLDHTVSKWIALYLKRIMRFTTQFSISST